MDQTLKVNLWPLQVKVMNQTHRFFNAALLNTKINVHEKFQSNIFNSFWGVEEQTVCVEEQKEEEEEEESQKKTRKEKLGDSNASWMSHLTQKWSTHFL